MAATTREKQDASVRRPDSRRDRSGTRLSGHGGFHLLATVLLSCAPLACGGRTNGDGGGEGGAGGTSGTAGAGAAGTGGAPADGGGGTAGDAGWTECATPDVEFCGTPECTCSTGDCFDPTISPWGDAGGGSGSGLVPRYLCWERWPTPQGWDIGVHPVRDGAILYDYPAGASAGAGSFWTRVPFSAGQFLAAQGEATRLAYADRASWTGEPLPMPTECPGVSGLRLCGGHCGGCPEGEGCTGRSPLHPWGFCAPEQELEGHPALCDAQKGNTGCEWGSSCFVFTVDTAHQAIADDLGLCLPRALCDAAAAGLPGGGRCVE